MSGRSFFSVQAPLKLGQARLVGAQEPAVPVGQLGDGWTGFLEGTDVPAFHRLTAGLVEPTEREPLGAADVGSFAVDPAGAVLGEEGTGSRRMRCRVPQQLCVVALDVHCLHLEDRQIVDTALGAAARALESIDVLRGEGARAVVDLGVKGLELSLGGARIAGGPCAHGALVYAVRGDSLPLE